MHRVCVAILSVLLLAMPLRAQVGPADGSIGTLPAPAGALDGLGALGGDALGGEGLNPASILARAAQALPGGSGGSGGGGGEQGGVSRGEGGGGGDGEKRGLSTAINVMMVLTVITLVPSIMLMTTCFLRIVIVLSLLKQALGTQQMPPSQVMLGLSLILTMLVMSPTIDRINTEAIAPYRAGQVTNYDDLWNRAKQPVRDFMFAQIDATGNYSSLYMVMNYRGIDTSDPSRLTRADVDMVTLVPAFVLSEMKVAFLMGFRIYLPFLVIDLVIAAILIAMNMMMLPPVLISLPFKLLLFVLVDGWTLIVGTLLSSFARVPGPAPGGGTSTSMLDASMMDAWWPQAAEVLARAGPILSGFS
jgi:flagellar biosynthetic protein FliP